MILKNIYKNVKKHGCIIRPWISVRYITLNEAITEENKLDVDYSVLIVQREERTDLAVILGFSADKAVLVENDTI